MLGFMKTVMLFSIAFIFQVFNTCHCICAVVGALTCMKWLLFNHFFPFVENLPAPPAELLKEDDETFPEPPPDYDENIPDEIKYPGLIPPHKLPNPVLDSNDRRQIHKDLKFNAKQ